jgi:hypothetical protein
MGDDHPRGEPGEWVSVREAARRLGITPKAVRDRIKHGSLQARPKGNIGREVLLPAGLATRENDGGLPGETTGEEAPPLPGEVAGEVAELLEEMAELRHALGRAEGELAVKDALVAELRGRAERAEAALAEARRPWLARVLEGLRRKG